MQMDVDVANQLIGVNYNYSGPMTEWSGIAKGEEIFCNRIISFDIWDAIYYINHTTGASGNVGSLILRKLGGATYRAHIYWLSASPGMVKVVVED